MINGNVACIGGTNYIFVSKHHLGDQENFIKCIRDKMFLVMVLKNLWFYMEALSHTCFVC
jgi:hypothetical protein